MATREVTLPPKLWLGSYEFPLHTVLPDDEMLEGADGITDTNEATRGIWIAASLEHRKALEIVWHEVTHAINWLCEMSRGRQSDEMIATKHGLAWSQFLLDNPRFCRWLTYTLARIRKERNAA